MFGYVKANKPEMRVKEYELYKAVYCSLCRELGKGYGPFARMTLSYDFTFLGVLLLALEPSCPAYQKKRCAFNPLVKCNAVEGRSESLQFTSAVAMSMLYHKLLDDLTDEKWYKNIAKRMVYPLFTLARRRARKDYPEADALISEAIQKQAAIEQGEFWGIDHACDPTASVLANLFACKSTDETEIRVLTSLGYCMGKWIYLIDALDDLEKDIADGAYNPIQLKYGLLPGDELTKAKQETVATLNVCISQAGAALELLNIKRYYDILANIIYLGLPDMQKQVLKKGTSK